MVLCLLLAVTVFAVGCSKEQTPYQVNDAQNYSVSVKFDANGGFFTTNTSVIVDSFNLSELKKDNDGQAQIALISPDSTYRDKNAFTAINNGYFLAGWYTSRTEAGTDSKGNPAYTYSGKWDFDKDLLTVDAGKTYSAAEPVLTLYAAWIPMFEIELYDAATGELTQTITYDPTSQNQILLPQWDQETGALKMNSFPEKSGYTFESAYYDAEKTQPVQEQVIHTGSVDVQTGTAKDPTMKLYVDWVEGEWFHIYTAEQFLENASVTGNYVLHADLDFTGKNWPTALMHGNFAGTILGNGFIMMNIDMVQTNNSKLCGGLFGQLTEEATLEDIAFDNITFTIKSGTRMAGTTYGLLAGSISEKSSLSNVTILSGTLQIDSGCYFGTDDYTIGLLYGMGQADIIVYDVTCKAVGDNPENVVITVNGNAVDVEFVTQ